MFFRFFQLVLDCRKPFTYRSGFRLGRARFGSFGFRYTRLGHFGLGNARLGHFRFWDVWLRHFRLWHARLGNFRFRHARFGDPRFVFLFLLCRQCAAPFDINDWQVTRCKRAGNEEQQA